MTKDATSRLMDEMVPWLDGIREYPGFKEWKRRALFHIIDYGEPDATARGLGDEQFFFTEHIERQHAAVASLLSLHVTHQALASTEFYFRRYPFNNLPVSREEHLRYTCEMYFSRIYEFSERLKRCLNNLNEAIPGKVNVGKIVKEFANEFRAELKARNHVHHHDRFEEIQINKVGLLETIALGDKRNNRQRGWDAETKRAYRTATAEWAKRAKRRSEIAKVFLNAACQAYIDYADFLREPVR